MAAYSFLDVQASIKGPGGNFSLAGIGNAEEGITTSRAEDKNTMNVGADGGVMHSLHAGKHGQVTIRLQKTSPTNALLMGLYNFQTMSAANHGQNVISIRNLARGDSEVCQLCAFKKVPDIVNAKDGNILDWVFDAGVIDDVLGSGSPVAA